MQVHTGDSPLPTDNCHHQRVPSGRLSMSHELGTPNTNFGALTFISNGTTANKPRMQAELPAGGKFHLPTLTALQIQGKESTKAWRPHGW